MKVLDKRSQIRRLIYKQLMETAERLTGESEPARLPNNLTVHQFMDEIARDLSLMTEDKNA